MDNKQNTWYVAGLAFECIACGRCCRGPEEGYVWLTKEEITAIANHLELNEKSFYKKFVRRVGRCYSLTEDKKTKNCVFLEDDGCTVYPVRPMQCRTWPFWESNISSLESWCIAGSRCPGINRGNLHSGDKIRRAADATEEH